eukprot:TRINITY_DN76535_c0_g1_i1.p1 TRINITY_DN76535_c0_g1~~TRINITY_DN76535_c0_g1_i1.p1  ORF type:complete len:442 (+),score=72.93 TRINITY_DN76535_c0_g1_i1:53-1378(+)
MAEQAEQKDDAVDHGDDDLLSVLSQPVADSRDSELTWATNAPHLYDMFLRCSLPWPALTTAWLPDVENELCRIVFGTGTDKSEASQVVVAELTCDFDDSNRTSDAWKSWESDGLSSVSLFCKPLDGHSMPLRIVAEMHSPVDVNRVAPCPTKPSLLAAKLNSGTVRLYDYKAALDATQDSREMAGFVASLEDPGAENAEGFALAWSPVQSNVVASAGYDGRLSIWDVQAASQTCVCKPLRSVQAHRKPISDLCFMPQEPHRLATVSDDLRLNLWDLRASESSQSPSLSEEVSRSDVLSVDWSPHDAHLLATSGKDKLVFVWDLRSMKTPLSKLQGHEGDVDVVKWCPDQEAEGILASCSVDGVRIWNLNMQRADDDDDGQPPELMFMHTAHNACISDFAWGLMDKFLMCSASMDNTLQVWIPISEICDDETEGPQAKRPRL